MRGAWRFSTGMAVFFAAGGVFGQTRPGAQTAPPRQPAAAAPAAAAPAPVSADPQMTTATYGDWLLRCQRVGEGLSSIRSCEVVQTIQAEGQGPVAQIAIGRAQADAALRITVLLPHNLSFPSAPQILIDDKDTQGADLAWRRCLPAGCLADADAKDDITRRWRAQTGPGRLRFKDAAGRDAALPFSFRGLAQALDALAKS